MASLKQSAPDSDTTNRAKCQTTVNYGKIIAESAVLLTQWPDKQTLDATTANPATYLHYLPSDIPNYVISSYMQKDWRTVQQHLEQARQLLNQYIVPLMQNPPDETIVWDHADKFADNFVNTALAKSLNDDMNLNRERFTQKYPQHTGCERLNMKAFMKNDESYLMIYSDICITLYHNNTCIHEQILEGTNILYVGNGMFTQVFRYNGMYPLELPTGTPIFPDPEHFGRSEASEEYLWLLECGLAITLCHKYADELYTHMTVDYSSGGMVMIGDVNDQDDIEAYFKENWTDLPRIEGDDIAITMRISKSGTMHNIHPIGGWSELYSHLTAFNLV